MANINVVATGKVKFGDELKSLAIFDVEGEVNEIQSDQMHHIHILDRSGSMWNHIDDLMEDVKKTLRMVDDNDFITILWFSGAGEFRTVVKGMRAGDREAIDKVLDNLKSTVGCTCFSDPIKELQNIIQETSPMCSVYNVTIFTDGDTVTPWSVQEETRRIFENLDAIQNKIVAFNAVGYGNYYNRALLLDMTKTTDYGQMTHASKIEEYSVIFNHNKQIVESLVGKRMKLECSERTDIIGLTTKTIKYGRSEIAVRLAKSRNTYAFITDDVNKISFTANGDLQVIQVNNNQVDFAKLSSEKSKDVIIDILYAYAYKLFESGCRRQSLDVLNFLGDKTLYDKQVNAFTVQEVGEHCKFLEKCVFSTAFRHTLEVGSNLCQPDLNAYCVFDLLKDLVKAKVKYIPTQNYKRITRKRTSEFDLFEADKDIEAVEMTKVILNQDRLNVSIKFAIPGHVKINPNRAKSVGLPTKVDAVIFRTHSIISDGVLNIEKMKVVADSPEVAEKFKNILGKLAQSKCKTTYSFDSNSHIVEIDLTGLPLINASYLKNASASKILEIESQMLEIEAQNKIINSRLSAETKFGKGKETEYTPEQIAVLIEHGMRQPGVYSSISPIEDEVKDYLVVREFRTMLKGFSTLPSPDKVLGKIQTSKKLTSSEALLFKYLNTYDKCSFNELNNAKRKNDSALIMLRFMLSAIKLAMILAGSWDNNFSPQQDGSFTYSNGGQTLIAKLERKEVPI